MDHDTDQRRAVRARGPHLGLDGFSHDRLGRSRPRRIPPNRWQVPSHLLRHVVWMLISLGFWTITQAVAYEERVDAVRAVEQARAAHSTIPSDPATDPEIVAQRVARELREESLLRQRFGVNVSAEMLSAEFERI